MPGLQIPHLRYACMSRRIQGRGPARFYAVQVCQGVRGSRSIDTRDQRQLVSSLRRCRVPFVRTGIIISMTTLLPAVNKPYLSIRSIWSSHNRSYLYQSSPPRLYIRHIPSSQLNPAHSKSSYNLCSASGTVLFFSRQPQQLQTPSIRHEPDPYPRCAAETARPSSSRSDS